MSCWMGVRWIGSLGMDEGTYVGCGRIGHDMGTIRSVHR